MAAAWPEGSIVQEVLARIPGIMDCQGTSGQFKVSLLTVEEIEGELMREGRP